MSTFLALGLALLGLVCIAAGVQNRGVQLGMTVLGGGGGTAAVAGRAAAGALPGHPLPTAAKAPTTAGVTFA